MSEVYVKFELMVRHYIAKAMRCEVYYEKNERCEWLENLLYERLGEGQPPGARLPIVQPLSFEG